MNRVPVGQPRGVYQRFPVTAWASKIGILGILALLFAAGCSDAGAVELNWVLVDRQGTRIYPGGQFAFNRFTSSCGLPGRIGDQPTTYDLQVELTICDPQCAGVCDDPACSVIDPLRFSCSTARGADPFVPASDEPYLFEVRTALILEDGSECTDPFPTCVTVPGPRERVVHPGLTTDLQVYQIALNVDAEILVDEEQARLDLEACGCV